MIVKWEKVNLHFKAFFDTDWYFAVGQEDKYNIYSKMGNQT